MKEVNHKRYFDKESPKRERVRLIFFPFLLLTLSVVAICCLVYWYLEYEKGIEGGSFVSLIVVAAAPFLMQRRVNLIENRKESRNRLLYFACVVPMLITVMSLQYYMDKSVGKLTRLGDVTEIGNNPPSRFYIIDNPVNTALLVLNFTHMRSSGRGRREYFLNTYCVTSVYSDVQSGTPAWLGKIYTSKVSLPTKRTRLPTLLFRRPLKSSVKMPVKHSHTLNVLY